MIITKWTQNVLRSLKAQVSRINPLKEKNSLPKASDAVIISVVITCKTIRSVKATLL